MPWRWRKWLKANPKVAWVNYAGLEDNDCYALHKKYCPKGAGSVFTFGLKGGYDAGIKLVNSVKLFTHLANVGDTRSLIIHPASTTHRQLSDEDRAKAGAGNDVVRLSIGIEDVADIIADLDQAMAGNAQAHRHARSRRRTASRPSPDAAPPGLPAPASAG